MNISSHNSPTLQTYQTTNSVDVPDVDGVQLNVPLVTDSDSTEYFSQLAELDETIVRQREALELSNQTSHSDRIGPIMDLGGSLETRFGQTGELSDLDAAIELYRSAFHPDPRSS